MPDFVVEAPLAAQRLRLLAASGVLLAAVVSAWAIWQPEASSRATTDAIRLADGGDVEGAISRLDDAADANPLTAVPLLTRGAIETQAGDEDAARESLEQAVLKFPGDPQTWFRLAAFQLGTLDQPAKAAATIQGAIFLDPRSTPNRILFLQARARERELAAAAAR